MIAKHIKTGDVYEGCRTYIASIVGVDRRTLLRWEQKKLQKKEPPIEVFNNYEVIFKDVTREKQRKGFALR